VKILILKDPYLCDDHFHSGWNTYSPGCEAIKDEDTLKIKIKTGYTAARCSKEDLNFNTLNYTKLAINCLELTGNKWGVTLRKDNDYIVGFEYTTSGFQTIDLSDYNNDIDEIELYVSGSEGESATFDYVAVCKDVLDPVQENRLKKLEINDCLLQRGVSYATLVLENINNYAANLRLNSRVLIWISKNAENLGRPKYKIFGGVINRKKIKKTQDKRQICEIECLGLGYQLQTPPKLISHYFEDQNGKNIITTVLEESQVNLSDYKVDPDNEIVTTFTKLFDEEKPFDIINKICEESKKSDGTQGFEGWVDSAGNLWVFPKGKYDNGLYPSINPDWIINMSRELDLHRVRNKVTVYGAWGGTYPENADMCESLTGWSLTLGSLMQLDNTKVKCGNYSIKVESDSDYNVEVKKTLDDFIDGRPKSSLLSAENIEFDVYFSKNVYSGQLELYAPDENNKFYLLIGSLTGGNWHHLKYRLGPDGDFSHKIGSPKWEKITAINFIFIDTSGTFTVYIDGVHFSNTRYKKTVEDIVSQSNYGVRCKEVIIDDSLISYQLCQLKAQSIINFLKNPIETVNVNILGGLLDEFSSNQRLAPGWKIYFVDYDSNTYRKYRIVEVTHFINENGYWTINLKLDNEPVYIDKVFRKLYALSQ